MFFNTNFLELVSRKDAIAVILRVLSGRRKDARKTGFSSRLRVFFAPSRETFFAFA